MQSCSNGAGTLFRLVKVTSRLSSPASATPGRGPAGHPAKACEAPSLLGVRASSQISGGTPVFNQSPFNHCSRRGKSAFLVYSVPSFQDEVAKSWNVLIVTL